ncbi:MAG: hypothetical protein OS112_04525 [Methanoregula sp.]|nr:MAG: hypothetical protein OS112_04525 [Methanoregula sp.]
MQWRVYTCHIPIVLFSSVILIILVIICGCVALPIESKPGVSPTPTLRQGSSTETTGSPGGYRSYVQEAAPIPEGSPREVRDLSGKSGEVSSPVMRKAIEDAPPVFTDHYTPKYSSSAFQIHVIKGPLIIKYQTIPLQYDPRNSFLKITVRNPKTGQIVAEDGYGNPYPSNTVNTIIINGEGDYHVTVYGNQVDVRVSVYTGDFI